jgi:hypothetical protein
MQIPKETKGIEAIYKEARVREITQIWSNMKKNC